MMADLDQTCVNTIRFLAVDSVEKAKSGHPGLPLGASPMAYVLWDRFLRHNPADPAWPNRDRFVLSAGHGSAMLYALLHLTGYDLPLEQLQRFRQWDSETPGHPEFGRTPGVEATTGPLGQGFGMAVGMAIAERHLAAQWARDGASLIDHYTYAIVSDGDLMEGIASEAASLAGTLGLGKLICLYDDNHVTLEGPTSWAFTEDVGRRFEAYGWQVLHVPDGNDLAAIDAAIRTAHSAPTRPTLIRVRTHLGYGSPVQDTREAHGEALGPANLKSTKETLGWPLEPAFLIPPEARDHMRLARARGAQWQAEWETARARFAERDPPAAARFREQWAGHFPTDWGGALPSFGPGDGAVATRDASQRVLASVGPRLPALVGGAADLSPSTKTLLPGAPDFSAEDGLGRNFHFGVREHAMVAALNGMALHGGLIPYGGTFLVFSDYARGAIRLAALQRTHIVLVFTHDSIGMGEDGPTHQPIEQLIALRAIPDLTVYRPADANETVAAWRMALERSGPAALVFTRQKVPVLDPAKYAIASGVPRGGYVLSEAAGGPPAAILVATGSEVALALDAQAELARTGTRVRVVSLPVWRVFDEQSEEYRRSVLPPGVPAVSIEAGSVLGWSRYVGDRGVSIGIDHFGASAPGPVLQQQFGFTVDHVVEVVRQVLRRGSPGE
ncbi:MAG TPA: transketolase [Thermoplasmata archaeon]|nr:transketolase [Thermoplasmata archaeon]